jgi:hypothetical protein
VNNKGLIVNGTITRSPVATGAELVAYSGFSAADYLEQPYNSALDFGTGDFSVLFWWNTANETNATPIERGDPTTTASRFGFYINNNTVRPYINTDIAPTGGPVLVGQWMLHAMVRRNGVLESYSNGRLNSTKSAAGSVSSEQRALFIGARGGGLNPTSGQMALIRISATAPTADQIRKIYEDEKALFQENAACTLYGTSDAVTALAHDQVTDLLHVGTSAGRSVFDGLVRVDNTTTPVGTAISAVNGLVVEE